MFRRVLKWLALLPLILVGYHTTVRIIRHFYKFPMPQFLAGLIDNPLRRKIQPPELMAEKHGVRAGMTVLEIGPGNGRYSVAAAQLIGPMGWLHAIDIEPKMIERVRQRAAEAGITNIDARVADAYNLPYPDDFFDAIYMITVTGEIPEPVRAFREFHRVLKPGATLAVSEVLLDPDYPLARTVTNWASEAGFGPVRQQGNFFAYTLTFARPT